MSATANALTSSFGPGVTVVLEAAGISAQAVLAGAGASATVLAQATSMDPVYTAVMLVAGITQLYQDKQTNNQKCKVMKQKVQQLSVILDSITPDVKEAVRGQLEHVVVALTKAANWYGTYSKKGALMKTLTSKEEKIKYELAKEALDNATTNLQLDLQLSL